MPQRKVPSIDTLQALYTQGLSGREIAISLGLNPNTVLSAMQRHGLLIRTTRETRAFQKARGVQSQSSRYWLGKKQPQEMVEKRISKIRGENHYLWKGGEETRHYRKAITKERCAQCDATTKLLIHHKDFDHYNNTQENLQVLCLGCHSRVHKQAYWDAIHTGEEPPLSNAPNHWGMKRKN